MSMTSGPHAIAARRQPDDGSVERMRLLRRAALLHLDGDLDAAEDTYTALIQDDPADAAVLNNLGLLRCQRGDARGALDAYDAIGSEDDLSATALVNKADARLMLGDVAAAIALLHRAAGLDPHSPAWAGLGQSYLLAGDLAAAEAAFRQAIDRLPPRVDVLRSYAACLAHRGELDAAASLLSSALALDQDDASSWRQLGAVLLAMHDLGSAARCARTAVELDPDDVSGRRQLAVVLVGLDRGIEAVEHLDHALQLARDPDLLVDRAVLHLAVGEYDEAIVLLTEGLGQEPSGRALLHLGYACLASGRDGEATEYLSKAAAMPGSFADQAREALQRCERRSDGGAGAQRAERSDEELSLVEVDDLESE